MGRGSYRCGLAVTTNIYDHAERSHAYHTAVERGNAHVFVRDRYRPNECVPRTRWIARPADRPPLGRTAARESANRDCGHHDWSDQSLRLHETRTRRPFACPTRLYPTANVGARPDPHR